jgi:Ulp1 family protease
MKENDDDVISVTSSTVVSEKGKKIVIPLPQELDEQVQRIRSEANLMFPFDVQMEQQEEGIEIGKYYEELRQEDIDTLSDETWLNTKVMKFWYWWVWNNVPYNNKALYLDSQKMYAIRKMEAKGYAYATRTLKKEDRDNFFSKKIIFLPTSVNKNHWSLCILLNIGSIKNMESYGLGITPHFIYLDSLDLLYGTRQNDSDERHNVYSQRIFGWLNYMWNSKNKEKNIFNNLSVAVRRPFTTQQNDGYNCGVYVCRYIYTMYLYRACSFTVQDVESLCQNFEYNQREISQLRTCIRIILSDLINLIN